MMLLGGFSEFFHFKPAFECVRVFLFCFLLDFSYLLNLFYSICLNLFNNQTIPDFP